MEVKGTAHYMSPEHFFDFRKADHRADIYSLGKILFEAIAGKIGEGTLPFKTATLENPETRFFEELDRIIQDATAEKKEERTDSVDNLHNALLDAIDTLKKPEAIRVSEKQTSSSLLHRSKWIWTGIAIAVISVVTMTFWHLFGESSKFNTHLKRLPPSDRTDINTEPLTAESAPATSILAEDGATLQFISGGEVTLPENLTHKAESVRKVDSFYMDVAPVTNHQYVQFLNQNLSILTIARGVVRTDDEIWLLLGEIFEGYNPIVFRKGKFHVSNAAYASFPVLRVTANGAAAYARFYSRRLPTYEEWLYAVGKGKKTEVKSGQFDMQSDDTPDMEKMHAKMMESQNKADGSATQSLAKRLSPVSTYKENKYGIRAMDSGFSEWSLQSASVLSEEPSRDPDYMLMPTGLIRQPWEAFEEVGFRSAQNVERRLVKTR
jgi:serine/threonine-protein kinase